MAEKTAPQTGATQATQAKELPMSILAQYVRDLSFENPFAPDSLKMPGGAPQMDVSIGLDGRKLPDGDNLYEVVLSARAEALVQQKSTFLCEVQYGAVVKLGAEVPDDSHHPMLFIEAPRQLFPFVRQIISTVVANGGFPPLYMAPVDFHALYLERFKDDLEASKKIAEAPAEGTA